MDKDDGVTDNEFIGRVELGLKKYKNRGFAPFRLFQSGHSKFAVNELEEMIGLVREKKRNISELRDRLALYEPHMGASLKQDLESVQATVSWYDGSTRAPNRPR